MVRSHSARKYILATSSGFSLITITLKYGDKLYEKKMQSRRCIEATLYHS